VQGKNCRPLLLHPGTRAEKEMRTSCSLVGRNEKHIEPGTGAVRVGKNQKGEEACRGSKPEIQDLRSIRSDCEWVGESVTQRRKNLRGKGKGEEGRGRISGLGCPKKQRDPS